MVAFFFTVKLFYGTVKQFNISSVLRFVQTVKQ